MVMARHDGNDPVPQLSAPCPILRRHVSCMPRAKWGHVVALWPHCVRRQSG